MKTLKNTKSIVSLFLLLIVFLLFSCHRSIKGSGDVTSETRAVEGFSSIQVSSALKVIYTQGPEYKVEVVADDNLIKYITTEVQGNELQIEIKNKRSFRKVTKAEIHITSPSLSNIEVSGASGFEITDTLNTGSLNLKLSGASILSVSGQITTLVADLSGASSVTLSGTAVSVNIEASGASVYHASNLITASAVIDFSGASSGVMNVQNNLNAKLSGASSLNYYGNPTVTSNLSGASSIDKK
jgi:hypothetical protein